MTAQDTAPIAASTARYWARSPGGSFRSDSLRWRPARCITVQLPRGSKGRRGFFEYKDFPVITSQTISIDGVDYAIDSLSENTKAQLISLQAVDRRIATAQEELAILQTARIAYGNAVKQELQVQ